MHMLVTVDEIGRLPEPHDESVELRCDLGGETLAVEQAAAGRRTIISASERNVPSRVGRKPGLIGLNCAGERDVQADRDPARAGVEHLRASRLGAVEARRRRP